MLQQVFVFRSFGIGFCTPLYGYTTVYLEIDHMMDLWIVSKIGAIENNVAMSSHTLMCSILYYLLPKYIESVSLQKHTDM